MVDDDKVVCSWKFCSLPLPLFSTLSPPTPGRQHWTISHLFYRKGQSFTIHIKCGGTISQDCVACFLLHKGQFLVDCWWDATCHDISSPFFHVSLKLYMDSDSKNMMVVFFNDGLITLQDGCQLLDCQYHAKKGQITTCCNVNIGPAVCSMVLTTMKCHIPPRWSVLLCTLVLLATVSIPTSC